MIPALTTGSTGVTISIDVRRQTAFNVLLEGEDFVATFGQLERQSKWHTGAELKTQGGKTFDDNGKEKMRVCCTYEDKNGKEYFETIYVRPDSSQIEWEEFYNL